MPIHRQANKEKEYYGMNEKMEMNQDEMEIDLKDLFNALKKKIVPIAFTSIVFAMIGLVLATFIIPKQYSSEATIYITPRISEQGSIDYNSIQTNSRMVNNYMQILQGETITAQVAEKVGLEDYKEVLDTLTISNATDTELIDIQSTTTDPQLAYEIVENTISVFNEEMLDVLRIDNLAVINEPKVNENPVSPSRSKFTLIGFAVGLIVSAGIVTVYYLFDNRLRTREAAENYLGIPVLAIVPYKR